MNKRLLSALLCALIIVAFLFPFLRVSVSLFGYGESIQASGFSMAFGDESLAQKLSPIPVGKPIAGLIVALILAALMLVFAPMKSRYAPAIRAVMGLVVCIILLTYPGEIGKYSVIVSLVGSIETGLGFWIALLGAVAATIIIGIEAFQTFLNRAAITARPQPSPGPAVVGNAAKAVGGESALCGSCGRATPKGNYCSFCASLLPQEQREWQCAGCRAVNERDARFCVACGAAKA